VVQRPGLRPRRTPQMRGARPSAKSLWQCRQSRPRGNIPPSFVPIICTHHLQRRNVPWRQPHDHFPSAGSCVPFLKVLRRGRGRHQLRPLFNSVGCRSGRRRQPGRFAWLATTASGWLSSSDWWLVPATTDGRCCRTARRGPFCRCQPTG